MLNFLLHMEVSAQQMLEDTDQSFTDISGIYFASLEWVARESVQPSKSHHIYVHIIYHN